MTLPTIDVASDHDNHFSDSLSAQRTTANLQPVTTVASPLATPAAMSRGFGSDRDARAFAPQDEVHERLASVRSRHMSQARSARSLSRSASTSNTQRARNVALNQEIGRVFNQVEQDVGFNMEGFQPHPFLSHSQWLF